MSDEPKTILGMPVIITRCMPPGVDMMLVDSSLAEAIRRYDAALVDGEDT